MNAWISMTGRVLNIIAFTHIAFQEVSCGHQECLNVKRRQRLQQGYVGKIIKNKRLLFDVRGIVIGNEYGGNDREASPCINYNYFLEMMNISLREKTGRTTLAKLLHPHCVTPLLFLRMLLFFVVAYPLCRAG